MALQRSSALKLALGGGVGALFCIYGAFDSARGVGHGVGDALVPLGCALVFGALSVLGFWQLGIATGIAERAQEAQSQVDATRPWEHKTKL